MSDTTKPARPYTSFDDAAQRYRDQRIAFWDATASRLDKLSGWSNHYHRRLLDVYRFLIPPNSRVLEIGCGAGDLIAGLVNRGDVGGARAIANSESVGIDFSPTMVELANKRHGNISGLRFETVDAHEIPPGEAFDAIILSEAVNDLWDVQRVLERVRGVCSPRTRLILNFYNRLWHWPLSLARKLGLAKPELEQNWLTPADIEQMLRLTDFETIRAWQEVLCPVGVPLVAPLCNHVMVKLPGWRHLGLTNFVVARPIASRSVEAPREERKLPRVSVIVPARNEAGNVEAIFKRTPDMLGGTELVFVEGHSSDDTYAAIERAIAANPQRSCKLFRQTGKGKGDAVRLGYDNATGDILMILDADLTVPPEDLPRFAEALASGRGEFINGVRLVYPMEQEAMQFANLIANRLFGVAFSWVLGQSVKDTLCGTKVLWARDYRTIAANRSYFGDFDPFGDFDLIFGAAKLNLRIADLPIRYRQRTYGTTNIQRWRHGVLLLRMLLFATRRIKFS